MSDKSSLTRKACMICGRPMTWRKKWALSWQGTKYCSDRCRKASKQSEGK